MHHRMTIAGLLFIGALMNGCAFSTTAKDWSGLKGLDNQPTYYTTTTKVGLNLFMAVPFIGNMDISGLTADLTQQIKEAGGNEVRIVQGTTESYFYGWPPFTWVLTPVISTVSAEYKPNMETYEKEQGEITAAGPPSRWYKPWSW